MATIRIIGRPKGENPRRAEQLAALDGEVMHMGERLWVDDRIVHQLVEVFGDGFLRKHFHTVWNGTLYENCVITNMGGPGDGAELDYMATREWSARDKP